MIDRHRVTPERRKGIAALPRGDGGDEVIVNRVNDAAHGKLLAMGRVASLLIARTTSGSMVMLRDQVPVHHGSRLHRRLLF
jgi:hypothetical protein